jgi:predicted alpha/beta-fold hydrolase
MGNYVARAGPDCALDAAVAVSGGLDMRYETYFYRAQRLWQPILAIELRDTFIMGKWGERVRHRLSKEQLKYLMRATHISSIDETAVVAYNGFDDLNVSSQSDVALKLGIVCS